MSRYRAISTGNEGYMLKNENLLKFNDNTTYTR